MLADAVIEYFIGVEIFHDLTLRSASQSTREKQQRWRVDFPLGLRNINYDDRPWKVLTLQLYKSDSSTAPTVQAGNFILQLIAASLLPSLNGKLLCFCER